jgi:hypothetical protein
MAETNAAVAIYWDFENVHACLMDEQAGEQSYRASARYRPQDVVVDVTRVADYAAGFGRVAVHRAYANWQFFGKYAAQLQAHAIDLVHRRRAARAGGRLRGERRLTESNASMFSPRRQQPCLRGRSNGPFRRLIFVRPALADPHILSTWGRRIRGRQISRTSISPPPIRERPS